MEGGHSTQPQGMGKAPTGTFRELLVDAMRFWEPGRLVYNLVLCVIVAIWIVASWPHFRPAITLPTLLPLGGLALIANVCYCAAYLVDISMQGSSVRALWRRRRWVLWLMGMLFATMLANYWIADEIYPYVG